MPYKDVDKQKESQQTYYQKNKDLYKARDKERKEEIKTWVRNYRISKVCEDCGEDRWQCLDFHHIDSSNKFLSISMMVRKKYSVEKIKNEIMKCKVICANCHRCHHSGNVWESASLGV